MLPAEMLLELDRQRVWHPYAPMPAHLRRWSSPGAGVWPRPFRDLVYTMPPYVTADEDVAAICAGVLAAGEAVTRGRRGAVPLWSSGASPTG